MSDLVGNPEDRFSRDAAQIRSILGGAVARLVVCGDSNACGDSNDGGPI